MTRGERTDIITPQEAGCLYGLFRERVRRTPDSLAYRRFIASDAASSSNKGGKNGGEWQDLTWFDMAREVARWTSALESEELGKGDRVAIWLQNRTEWVVADLAALSLGLVTVPVYSGDRPENIAYILSDSVAKLLIVEDESDWENLLDVPEPPVSIKRVVTLKGPSNGGGDTGDDDSVIVPISAWLPEGAPELIEPRSGADRLATIVYTSGTTGHPKGVMLSHGNILWNAHGCALSIPLYRSDLFLSFLPLSHTFERTAGYYLPIMTGSSVVYARSIDMLAEDMLTQQPTLMISVPRLFEKIYAKVKTQLASKPPLLRALFEWTVRTGWERFEYRQGRGTWSPSFIIWPLINSVVTGKVRSSLGGRLRLTVSGGAALSPEVARFFIGIGVPLVQGYGMTEASPVISVNTLADNIPASAGTPLKDVLIKIGKDDEIIVKSPGVMGGYWNLGEATAKVIDTDGWLHTGDTGSVEGGHIFIKGRIKEIIILSNGEKIPPADVEGAIALDRYIDQVLVFGEGRPYLSALVVLTRDGLSAITGKDVGAIGGEGGEAVGTEGVGAIGGERGSAAGTEGVLNDKKAEEAVLDIISKQMHAFPGYEVVRRAAIITDPWTIENGLLTPTLKYRRNRILDRYRQTTDDLYEGHTV